MQLQPDDQSGVEALAQHLPDEELFNSEEAAEVMLGFLESSGGMLFILESSYWGKETFGNDGWTEMWIGDVVVETDDGIKVDNAFDAEPILGIFRKFRRAEQEIQERDESDEDDYTLPASYYEGQLDEALEAVNEGSLARNHELGDGWFPKSKVRFQAYREGPQEFVVYVDDERQRGVRDDAEVVIDDTTLVHTRHRRYEKLAIDLPYKEDFSPKDDIEELTWEDFHFTAKFDNANNFECWVSDTKPREVAQILSQHYNGVAVHEDLLERYND